MNKDSISRIEIINEFPIFGKKDSLESRLRAVSLRGFSDVRIYQNATFKLERLDSLDIPKELSTPQPHLHREYLDRIGTLAKLFAGHGINIFHLTHAYDYNVFDQVNGVTTWTLLPPVVENMIIPQHPKGGFDYSPLIGDTLALSMQSNNWTIEPATQTMSYPSATGIFRLINDGSHRVHAGLENNQGVTILEISGVTPGFPYYAAPQSYSRVQVFDELEKAEDLKVHVITSPGQKQLYRLFPSGGIMSGGVRPPRGNERYL